MIDISKIEKLMVLMEAHGLDVVQAETAGEKISLARKASHAHLFQEQVGSYPSHKNTAPQDKETSSAVSTSTESSVNSQNEKKLPAGEVIKSPFVGTFYRAAGPDVPFFVEVGSKVKKGQSLCIVEAMKLMNEIESEIEGEIVAILVENAKPVEFGTPLFIVAPYN